MFVMSMLQMTMPKKMTLTAALFLYDPWNVIRKTQKLEISDA